MTYLILIGDGLHNFLGGLSIAGVFLVDVRLGIAAWIAAAAHEVPQELGDFGVLVHGGWKKRAALLLNLLSGLTFLVGGLVAYAASVRVDVRWLVPLAAGFGCTTCIGNSGPLDRELEDAITRNDLVVTSALSGNRNFEGRIHQSVKANFVMSPPLVVAFAIAGRVDIDLTREPLGIIGGREVHLRDVWPSAQEVAAVLGAAYDPAEYRRAYADVAGQGPPWSEIPAAGGLLYEWDPASLYIREPPYFDPLAAPAPAGFAGARALAIFGDSITTDHISPAGAIKPTSPAGLYLRGRGVPATDFNSYGARRGNHEVMVRGTFANVRLRNLMVPGVEGGVTIHRPGGERMSIHEAAERYRG